MSSRFVVLALALAFATSGCAAVAKEMFGYNADAPACNKQVPIIEARLGQAPANPPSEDLSGAWKCIADGYDAAEYWQLSQQDGYVSVVISATNGERLTIDGVVDGDVFSYKSQAGALGEMQIRGGAMKGPTYHPGAASSCTIAKQTCVRYR